MQVAAGCSSPSVILRKKKKKRRLSNCIWVSNSPVAWQIYTTALMPLAKTPDSTRRTYFSYWHDSNVCLVPVEPMSLMGKEHLLLSVASRCMFLMHSFCFVCVHSSKYAPRVSACPLPATVLTFFWETREASSSRISSVVSAKSRSPRVPSTWPNPSSGRNRGTLRFEWLLEKTSQSKLQNDAQRSTYLHHQGPWDLRF